MYILNYYNIVGLRGPEPVAVRKYNNKGFAQPNLFLEMQVSDRYAPILAKSTNMALAENTKSQYRTAVNHVARVEAMLGVDMSPPFDTTKTLNYVGYLLEDRNCCANTVDVYLSGLRMWHLCMGMDVSSLRPPIVSLILKGREHWENIEETLRNKTVRTAVTLKVMKYLDRKIFISNYPEEKKLMLKLICRLLFCGSLRVHEVLAKTKDIFDPLVTLCKEDIELVTDTINKEQHSFIRLHLKSPKERRVGKGVKLEIYGNGTFCCPVLAWNKWKRTVNLRDNQPVFQQQGRCFTGQEFNKILTEFTSDLTEGSNSVIRPHSFRSGMATEMALR